MKKVGQPKKAIKQSTLTTKKNMKDPAHTHHGLMPHSERNGHKSKR